MYFSIKKKKIYELLNHDLVILDPKDTFMQKPILRQMTNGELTIIQCIYKVGIRCFGGLPEGVKYKL